MKLAVLAVAGVLPALVGASSEAEPHFHRGKLSQYSLGKPKVLISAADEQRLQQGEAVMQAVSADDGSRRMVMVQDLEVPANVVMGCAPPRTAAPAQRSGTTTDPLRRAQSEPRFTNGTT